MCFAQYPNLSKEKNKERENYKKWYKDLVKNISETELFKRWAEDNTIAVSHFKDSFVEASEYLFKINHIKSH